MSLEKFPSKNCFHADERYRSCTEPAMMMISAGTSLFLKKSTYPSVYTQVLS